MRGGALLLYTRNVLPGGGVPAPNTRHLRCVLSLTGSLPPNQEEEPEDLDDAYMPDGLSEEMWQHFRAYRASKVRGGRVWLWQKGLPWASGNSPARTRFSMAPAALQVRCEREARRLQGKIAVLRVEVPQLEAQAAALQATSDGALAEVQRLRAAHKSALHDCVLQLKLKAGQVEVSARERSEACQECRAVPCDPRRPLRISRGSSQVTPGPGELGADDSGQALLVHRQRVEGLNTAVRAKVRRLAWVILCAWRAAAASPAPNAPEFEPRTVPLPPGCRSHAGSAQGRGAARHQGL